MRDPLTGANVKIADENLKLHDPTLEWSELRDMAMGDEHWEVSNTFEIIIDEKPLKARLLITIVDMLALTGEAQKGEEINGTVEVILDPSELDIEFETEGLTQCEESRDMGSATVLIGVSSDWEQLLEDLKANSTTIPTMIGYYLDRPQNQIGSTGWETLVGDLHSAVRRLSE